jgi:hypothetical protein
MLHRVGLADASVTAAYRRITMSDAIEAGLATELAAAWHARPAIPSLLSLKQALSRRLLDIRELASREETLGDVGRSQRLAEIRFLHIHFMQAASFGVELFNDTASEPDGKWALLFDELELAPDWIRDELIRSLRGTDERFLLKLALSPYSYESQIVDVGSDPAPGHDYDQIPLWYAHKQDGYPFCEKLWQGMLRERGMPSQDPRQILGRSYFETESDEWTTAGNAYSPGSRLGKAFIRLAEADPSFAAYLRAKGIDPRRLHKLPADERAADVRKVAPLIPVREYYRKFGPGDFATGLRGRSRKQATLYAGAESLFAITEGNPRWFIGIVEGLLDRWRPGTRQISPTVQADEMIKAGQRFSALLRTIPLSASLQLGRGVVGFLNYVGEFFHEQVVTTEFAAEPAGTFTVDAHIPASLEALIGQALNAGALVYVPTTMRK